MAGVIHFPLLNETVWGYVTPSGRRVVSPASMGEGDPLPVSRHSKIIVSRSHTDSVEKLVSDMGPDVTVTQAGGAGYKSVAVARKDFDAYLHTGAIKKWDICAPNALLKAVGGDLTGLQGQIIRYGMNDDPVITHGLAATSENHAELLKRLKLLVKERI